MSVFKRLDHVAIGVENIDDARDFFTGVLGAEPLKDRGESPQEGFVWETFMLGGKKVELVCATTPGEGGVGRYIAKHGQGYHHMSISVENLEESIKYFESKGVTILSASTDDENWKHYYLHPKHTYGALIQVFEENQKTTNNAQ